MIAGTIHGASNCKHERRRLMEDTWSLNPREPAYATMSLFRCLALLVNLRHYLSWVAFRRPHMA